MFGNHCASCHTTCGDCHISQPNSVGGMNAWIKGEFPVETGAPAAPVAGAAPEFDAARFAALDVYLSGLPEGFNAIKAPDFNTEIAGGTVPFILDVRSQAEWDADDHIEGAVLIPITDLPASLDQLPADKATPIVVMCKSGHRGGMAQMYLQFLGYTGVRNLNGGLNGLDCCRTAGRKVSRSFFAPKNTRQKWRVFAFWLPALSFVCEFARFFSAIPNLNQD